MSSFSGEMLARRLHHILHTKERAVSSCLPAFVCLSVSPRTLRVIKVSSQLVLLGSHTGVVTSAELQAESPGELHREEKKRLGKLGCERKMNFLA